MTTQRYIKTATLVLGLSVLVVALLGFASERNKVDLFQQTSTKSVAQVEAKVKSVAKQYGYGLVASHNMTAVLAKKGFGIQRQVRIFELCSPRYAQTVMQTQVEIATVLPCRIAVWEHNGKTVLAMVNPKQMLGWFQPTDELTQGCGPGGTGPANDHAGTRQVRSSRKSLVSRFKGALGKLLLTVWLGTLGSCSDTPNANQVAPIIRGPDGCSKVCQLVGNTDLQTGQPVINQTLSRSGIYGTDLGVSFEHDGKLWFLFGDTVGTSMVDEDAIAFSSDNDPNDCVELSFLTDANGKWIPPVVPNVSQGSL